MDPGYLFATMATTRMSPIRPAFLRSATRRGRTTGNPPSWLYGLSFEWDTNASRRTLAAPVMTDTTG
jgi:hypothetical protein